MHLRSLGRVFEIEFERTLRYFVNSLNRNEPQALIAYLYFVEGYSPAHIARILGIQDTEHVRNVLRNIKRLFDERIVRVALRRIEPRIREALERWLNGSR